MLEWMATYLSRHVWAVLLTVLNSLVLKDMRLGGRGLGDDLQKCEWWVGERKHVWSRLIVYMYEIPKELIKDGEFFPNNFSTFCIFQSVVIFSGFSRGSAEVMSAMHLQMTTVPQWVMGSVQPWTSHKTGGGVGSRIPRTSLGEDYFNSLGQDCHLRISFPFRVPSHQRSQR